MSWRKAIIPALIVLPFLAVLALGFGTDPHAVPSVLEGQPAPQFSLRSLDGEVITPQTLAGKPALLNFWSTWCEPCKFEHELLQQASRFYGDKVRFIGIVYQDEEENVRRYLKRHTNLYTQVMDDGSKTAIDFGVAGVPESFILDASGMIRHKQTGVMTGDVLRDTLGELTRGAL